MVNPNMIGNVDERENSIPEEWAQVSNEKFQGDEKERGIDEILLDLDSLSEDGLKTVIAKAERILENKKKADAENDYLTQMHGDPDTGLSEWWG